jgi:hypothetical protein
MLECLPIVIVIYGIIYISYSRANKRQIELRKSFDKGYYKAISEIDNIFYSNMREDYNRIKEEHTKLHTDDEKMELAKKAKSIKAKILCYEMLQKSLENNHNEATFFTLEHDLKKSRLHLFNHEDNKMILIYCNLAIEHASHLPKKQNSL